MRNPITTLLTAVVLMLGVTIVAPPVAAAPAEPVRDSGCVNFFGFEYCYETHAVVKVNETPSGGTQAHLSGNTCHTVTDPTGEVVEESCYKSNLVLHQQDGEFQVYHSNEKRDIAFEYQGTHYECMFSSNATYANGEFRHGDAQVDCNPPL